jgi:glycosyltransferase involved in cell wall biosynthesis
LSKNRLKLMQITHDLAIGGLQQVVVNICKNIDREKFDVSVLCLRDLGEFTPDVEALGIKVILLPSKKNGTDYLAFLKVAEILKEEQVEVIHTHNTQPFVDGTIGAVLAGVKTIIHTDHARHFPDKRRYMFAEWLMSHFAYKVVGVSDHTSRNLIHYEHISSSKIQIIFNGIDKKVYDISIDKDKKIQSLNINVKGPIIGLGVRLAHQKGITYLLKAMPKLLKHFPELALVVAGQGELAEELKAEAVSLGIDNHVYWIGPRLDMPEILKIFDLYVLPSLFEGMPMVLLESMAAGCPVIATDVGGNGNVIDHGRNGSLVPPKDPQMFGDEIIRVLSSPDLMKQYTSNAMTDFDTKFSSTKMVRKYEALYMRQS